MGKSNIKKGGYTFWTKDWQASQDVFDLNLEQRGLYRELIDLAHLNENKVEYNPKKMARQFNANVNQIETICELLRNQGLIQFVPNPGTKMLTIPSVQKRVDAINHGRYGGNKSVEKRENAKGSAKGNAKGSAKDKASQITNNKKQITNNKVKEYNNNTNKLFENNSLKTSFLRCLNLFDKIDRPETPKQKFDWVDCFEKLNRIDGLEFTEIEKIIEFARKDEFWTKNLLSMLGLRKKNGENIPKWRNIQSKMNESKPTSHKPALRDENGRLIRKKRRFS